MTEKKLISEVKAWGKKCAIGDVLQLEYEGQIIGEYENIDNWHIDSKTPEQWIRGCIAFEIKMKGRDIEKCTLVKK